MTEPVNETPVQRIQRLLGEQVVLVWMERGTKGPKFRGWQKQTLEHMGDARYVANLNSGHNLGVLVGAPSGGVCSIDIDDDASVEPFLALNPQLRGTLFTRGKRGGNLWVKIRGQYPGSGKLETRDGKAWGEWRSTGNQTVIHGVHPEGMEYRAVNDAPAIELTFGEIVWPDDVALPWKPRAEVPQDDSADAELRRRFGDPVFISESKDGESSRVSGINEAYWAGLYSAEHISLYEPDERTFYRYHEDTGLYAVESADAIKQAISARMLEVSREFEHLDALSRYRNDRTLNAITAQLRGIIEEPKAFAEKQRIVHLSNGVIVFDEGGFRLEPFSPKFRSRNRSPIAYDPAATCPRFLNELIHSAVHSEDALLLQKMAGQNLLGVNITQRLTLLDGLEGRGKTQYAIVQQKMIGQENVTQLRTQHLGERFELFRFLRKTLLVGVDVDENFLSSKGAPVIKGLVGGDWFDAEMKGGTGCFPLQGRFNALITSNCRLRVRLQGDVGAWRRRLLIVRYEAPKPAKIIHDFADLLIREEGSGILNWALEGLALLLKDVDETGDVRLTERQRAMVDSLLEESDSLRVFLRERVERADDGALTTQEIVERYAEFCPERGWDPLPITAIHRQLESLMLELFQVCRSNSVERDGKSQKGFRGVTFKSLP
jgi:phage/plasmid-associated DNA primase